MRVLVTGGTGFVGSHSVAAFVAAGHEVRLRVRAPDRVAPALDALGVPTPELAVGDVTDPASVESAMSGCEALLHCASVYSLDPRDAERIRSTTVRGTEAVLGAARRQGLDPIVHVSSYVALLPARGVLGPDSPPGNAPALYPRSKAESDLVARRHQDEGAPVVIVCPGAVIGPHDPPSRRWCPARPARARSGNASTIVSRTTPSSAARAGTCAPRSTSDRCAGGRPRRLAIVM